MNRSSRSVFRGALGSLTLQQIQVTAFTPNPALIHQPRTHRARGLSPAPSCDSSSLCFPPEWKSTAPSCLETRKEVYSWRTKLTQAGASRF